MLSHGKEFAHLLASSEAYSARFTLQKDELTQSYAYTDCAYNTAPADRRRIGTLAPKR